MTKQYFVSELPERIAALYFSEDFDTEEKKEKKLYSFYINGEILPPENYSSWFHTIRYAGPDDGVIIHINSQGGDVATAIQFMRAMKETDATVIASVEGDCVSAATMIFLAAEYHEVTEHSTFMFHNYSSACAGKFGEMYDGIVHARKWGEKVQKSVYANFLSLQEIEDILNGKDLWMDAEEVIRRLSLIEDKKLTNI